MLNVTKKFRSALFNDHQHFLEMVSLELSSGTKLELTNEHLMEPVEIEDMVSEDGNFQIGAAIINRCTLSINNMYDDFTDYVFDFAKVSVSVGLEFSDGTKEIVRKFTGYVDEAKYDGSVIQLSCLDNLGKFDYTVDGTLSFPNTLGGIVRYCCARCNVSLGSASFPRDDLRIASEPDFGSDCTYRQLVSWVAQICCCFARCDAMGRLTLGWYDMAALNTEGARLDGGEFDKGTTLYKTGDHADGGGFMTNGDEYDGGNFTTSTGVHNIVGIFACEVCKDPVTISGISVTSAQYEVDTVDGEGNATTESTTYTAMVGTDDYVLSISDNPLISSPEEATSAANFIAAVLVGFTFWTGSVTHLGNPAIEAGDVMLFYDHKGKTYRGIVSSTTFSCGDQQQTRSSAQTPTQNAKQQRSSSDVVSETIQKLENWLRQQKTAYEIGIDDLTNALNAKSGLYMTKEGTGSGEVWYLHDKPNLKESSKVIKITADAIGFSTDGGKTWNSGMTIDGNFVAKIMSSIGVNAEWGIFGRISDKTGANYWDMDTGEFQLGVGAKVKDGNTTKSLSAYIDNRADAIAQNYETELTQDNVFNALTKNGTIQGIYRTGEKLYVNAEYIKTGTLADANGNTKFNLATGEFTMKKGSLDIGSSSGTYHFKVDTDGELHWKSRYSSLDNSGKLSASGVDISGTLTTVDGKYKTVMDDGWIYFNYDGSKVGKIGAALMTNGNAFNINMMSDAKSFGVYSGDAESATALMTYTKSNKTWDFTGGGFNWIYEDTAYMSLSSGKLYVPYGSIYSKGYRVITEDDLVLYSGGYIKWKNADNGHLDGT